MFTSNLTTDLARNDSVIWSQSSSSSTAAADLKNNVRGYENNAIVGLPATQGLIANIRWSLFCLIVIVILLGNLLTLWAVYTTNKLRVKTYALTTSLAVADLMIGVLLVSYVTHQVMSEKPCYMATYKSAVRPLERLSIYASFLHIAAIAVDRFLAVVHPLHYENRVTPTTIKATIIVIWLVAAVGSVPPYLGFLSVIKPQSCIVTLWPVFEAFVELAIYSMNSSVVVFVYARIWSAAMRHKDHHEHFNAHPQQLQQEVGTVATDAGNASPNGRSSGNRNDLSGGNVVGTRDPVVDKWERLRNLIWKHRATRTVMVLLIMYVLLWFPYYLSRLLGVVSKMPDVITMQTVGSMLGLGNISMNVFVYGIMNKDFRSAYKRILHVGKNEIHPQ